MTPQESIDQCRKALEIDPAYPNASWFLALSLEQIGSLQESIATLERVVEISHAPHFMVLLGRACALSGAPAKALEILNELTTLFTLSHFQIELALTLCVLTRYADFLRRVGLLH